MRNADSSASYGYDGPLLEDLAVILNYPSNRFDSLGRSKIGQEYQSRVRKPSQVDQFPEVLVHSDKNPILCRCSFQQCPVAGVWAKTLRFDNVVSVAAQPLRQPSPGTSVDKKSHRLPTETGARVSPAITVWA